MTVAEMVPHASLLILCRRPRGAHESTYRRLMELDTTGGLMAAVRVPEVGAGGGRNTAYGNVEIHNADSHIPTGLLYTRTRKTKTM
jgi:hypothetical protein